MIINISEEYVNYLYNFFKGEIEMPFKNNGFNMGFTKYKDSYIFVIRNVYPIKNIIEKKELIPGISNKRFTSITNKSLNINNSQLSEYFIWNWRDFYETSIIFTGKIDDNLNVIIDKNIDPHCLINPRYNLEYIKNKNNINNQKYSYFPARMSLGDFRIYNFNGKIYLIDSTINNIYQVFIKNNKICIFVKYTGICNIKISKHVTYDNNNNNYTKIFEKNWSLYNVVIDDNNEKLFSFFHDFSKNGIEAIDYNPITKRCKKRIIIKYDENRIPYDNKFIRFSFGSSCIKINSYNKNGYIGVGHFKNEFNNKKLTNSNDYEKYYYDLYKFLNNNLYKIFKDKYKPHFSRQYYLFFYMYDYLNNKFYISDFYLPIHSYKYIFSLYFPISIVKLNDDAIISGGYGDYTNILIKMSLSEILNTLKYDITEIDILKLKLHILS